MNSVCSARLRLLRLLFPRLSLNSLLAACNAMDCTAEYFNDLCEERRSQHAHEITHKSYPASFSHLQDLRHLHYYLALVIESTHQP